MASKPSESMDATLDPLLDLVRTHTSQPPISTDLRLSERRALTAWKEARTRSHRGRIILSTATTLAAIAVAVFLFHHDFRRQNALLERALTYTVAGETANEGYVRVANNGPASTLHFSDGTEVALDPGSAGRVESINAHGAEVMLEQGRLHGRVIHRDQASWRVLAGPFAIAVRGTEFDVEWSPTDERFSVTLIRGAVRVRGPFSETGIDLEAGHRLVAHGHERNARIEAIESPQLTSTPESPAVTVISDASTVARELAEQHSSLRHAAASSHSPTLQPTRSNWSGMTAEGETNAVLQEATAQGIDQVLSARSASDLGALADAARYEHRPDLARRVFMSLRTRFPGTSEAQPSAFFLARIAETDDAGQAEIWYRRYLDENPSGGFAPEALGHEMLAADRAGHHTDALRLAGQYLERYPDSPYAPAAHRIVAHP